MKTLILTEKPSVAADFARALNTGSKRRGFYENDRYIVTWAVGHLLELLEPREYRPEWKTWRLETLPIIPQTFRYKAIPKTAPQLEIIQSLMGRAGDVVVATDAGREGEVIGRTILETTEARENRRCFRFWTSQALTPEVIRDTLHSVKPLSAYDRLWHAGRARQIADWLVGMNGTRAASRNLKDLFSVGRVQTAVLALIVDRRRERDRFTPKPYWLLKVLFINEKGAWWGTWFHGEETRFSEAAAADSKAETLAGATGEVLRVQRRKRREPPPPLYSLTTLQRDANKRFGFSARKTLDLAQNLYERFKCISYPRTDAEVLGTRNVDMIRELTAGLAKTYPEVFKDVDPRRIALSNKRVFNDARLTDHHAIIPLKPIPERAGADAGKIYDLVLRRFSAVFHPDCEFEQTEVITGVSQERFRTRGKRILRPGWRVLYHEPPNAGKEAAGEPDEAEAESLPPLEKGDPANVEQTRVQKRMTQPPPEYTEALLLKDMTHPARYVTEDELKKIYRGDVGLGTQATRAQIIETLLSRKYVIRRKRHLIATDKGCLLIDTLRNMDDATRILARPEETARWERSLERIAQGDGDATKFLNGIEDLVRRIVAAFQKAGEGSKRRESIGKCPRCGGWITETAKGYGCANWKKERGGCRFTIWKTIAGKSISREVAKALLENRRSDRIDGFRSKKGNLFSAALRLTETDDGWQVRFDFDAPEGGTSQPPDFGTCPACGGRIIEGRRGYGCANWKPEKGGCRFVIWKNTAGKALPISAVRQLLETGETEVMSGFLSESGHPFEARLKVIRDSGNPPEVVLERKQKGPAQAGPVSQSQVESSDGE